MARRHLTAATVPAVDSPTILSGEWVQRGLIRVFVPTPEPPPKTIRRYEKHPSHGSVAGYRRHRNDDEMACDECVDAMRAHWRVYRTTSPGRRQPPSPCGTYNAYKRHQRMGEEVCAPCQTASREYFREYRQKVRARAAAERSGLREAA